MPPLIGPSSVTLSSEERTYTRLERSSLHPLPLLLTRLSHSVPRARGADSAPSIQKRTNACSVGPCILLTNRPFFTVTTYLTLKQARLEVERGICNGYFGSAWLLLFLWEM